MNILKIVAVFLFAANLITFLLYGIDKARAVKGKWRISEKTLLLMGLCFGSIGQLAGMKVFRHKTHKWYFVVSGWLFLILHIVILYYIFTKRIVF